TTRSSVLIPSQIKATILPTRAVVLPVPAAASTNNVVPKSVRMRRLASSWTNLAFETVMAFLATSGGAQVVASVYDAFAAPRRDTKPSGSRTTRIAARPAPLAETAGRAPDR